MYYKFSDNDSCEGCLFFVKRNLDNPDYCKRFFIGLNWDEYASVIEKSELACKEAHCPHHISLADLKYIQDKYEPF